MCHTRAESLPATEATNMNATSSTPAMKRAVGPGGKRIPKRKPDAAASSARRGRT